MVSPSCVMQLSSYIQLLNRKFKALEERDMDRAMHKMKYWIVFSFFHAAEHIGDSFFWWIPGYQIGKFLFMLWCLVPLPYNGSAVLYDNYIQPTFIHNRDTLEQMMSSAQVTIRRMSLRESS
ncbi:receptor expression-enhancing protein 6-like [Stegodyphus dumicola]|uniref:receptor expression-enhancing protein 6-like n=1 Tax=Stegodyphus dumicola TaxID=202533 RepID=UPI0015A8FFD2|nr:receptor expression-enhancing protein 6-like [Stegodyphus dumicola]